MNTIFGLLIISIGSMGQSSSYVPINKIKDWSWENFWLIQGIFAWLLFPLLGAFMANNFSGLLQIYTANSSATLQSIGYGVFLAGLLWYSQFFGLGMGQSFFEPGSVMMAFSWSILMSLNVVFSNVWGIILKEWKGAGEKAIYFLAIGMAVLIFSLIVPNLF
ncbi:MAG: L-rhamnose/proton symporter RhaT [Proteiniphilum sp.]